MSIVAADLNGDGKPDLAVGSTNVADVDNDSSAVIALWNGGSATFAASCPSTTPVSPAAMAAADLNGDGVADLVTANDIANTVTVLLSHEGPPPCVPVDDGDTCTDDLCQGGVPVHVSAADGTPCTAGDPCTVGKTCQAGVCSGGQPLACSGGSSCVAGACVALACTGPVTFAPAAEYPTAHGAYGGGYGIVALDLNRDGSPDLAVGGHVLSVLINQGDGTFAPAVGYPMDVDAVAGADLNGDGWPDLVVGDMSGDTVSVLFNAGDGTFATAVDVLAGAGPAAITAVDLNGDGSIDLAVADWDQDGGAVIVLINDGSGRFAAAPSLATDTQPASIAAADLNGDGKVDLAVTNGADKVTVFLGHGDGTFAPGVDYTTGMFPSSVAAADLNGDGSIDLAVANSNLEGDPIDDTVSVLLNQGDGTFAPKVDYRTGRTPFGVVALDLNGDGKPDLATANEWVDRVSVLMNQGDGTFAPKIDVPTNGGSMAIAGADFDGDGRPDIADANIPPTVTVLLDTCQP